MASLSTCHLGLWLGWQILLNLVKDVAQFAISFLSALLYPVLGIVLLLVSVCLDSL